MRPNIPSKRFIEQHIQSILPKSLDPKFSIGMPVRGSDKCKGESDCLQFDEYMELAKEAWDEMKTEYQGMVQPNAPPPPSRASLILTTEDRAVFENAMKYNTTDFPLDFVVNKDDIMQSSGNFVAISKTTKEDSDQIMLSSMIAMSMQFHARYVYSNCCSNFHNLIFEFLRLGCGVHQELIGEDLTKRRCYPNICCGWTSKSECEYIRASYNQTLAERKARQDGRIASTRRFL